jgi:hypothetical protein
MSLALAMGQDPLSIPVSEPTAGAAASLVYRAFSPHQQVHHPSHVQRHAFAKAHPDALLFHYPKEGHSLARDYKWLGSHRYAIVHLGGHNEQHLRERALLASTTLGWPAPYAEHWAAASPGQHPAPAAPAPSARPVVSSPQTVGS